MKILLPICLLTIFISCKKDGLSKETGNLEIKINSQASVRGYYIYTEEQWYKYLSHEQSIPIYTGTTSAKFTIEGLQRGFYGVVIYDSGNHWDKVVSIIPNKVNKLSFP